MKSRLLNKLKICNQIKASMDSASHNRGAASRSHNVIYTDGACSNNGRSQGASAGIGIYDCNNPENNISQPIYGRQTNQRAEIIAASTAINRAKQEGYSDITIRTDSQYVKNAAESWIPKWEQQNWSQKIVNKDEFKDLRDSMRGINVTFEKVPSAENAADSLARQGAKK